MILLVSDEWIRAGKDYLRLFQFGVAAKTGKIRNEIQKSPPKVELSLLHVSFVNDDTPNPDRVTYLKHPIFFLVAMQFAVEPI